MPSSFKLPSVNVKGLERGPQFWLQSAVGALALLNLVALYFYIAPPGGTRAELTAQSQHLRTQVAAARGQTNKLKRVSTRVQLGGEQSVNFESQYVFPKRQAYEAVIAEIQRMAQGANLNQREGTWSEEAIEGTPDLTVLTNTTNFEGSYPSLMKFLYEVDRSSKLLMLDTLTATPQKAGQVTAQMKFQAIIRDIEAAQPAGGQP